MARKAAKDCKYRLRPLNAFIGANMTNCLLRAPFSMLLSDHVSGTITHALISSGTGELLPLFSISLDIVRLHSFALIERLLIQNRDMHPKSVTNM